ncbi:MAG: hypothetical protein LBP67_05525 [Bacteroidales bacterium]|jgi:hypothetical protein|nr:hypothetical protein [Bacteroidales bacterium]
MKKIHILLFIFICRLSLAQEINLQTGDFLFQVGKGSDFEKAIVSSTQRLENLNFSHVGVVYIEDDIFVLEAEPDKGVVKSTLKEFIENGDITVVGRLKEEYQYTIPDAINRILKHIGGPYNFTFQVLGEGLYCSELIQKNFILNNGEHLFEPISMSFRNNDTGEIHDFWIQYYDKYGVSIPEGEDGSNPNMIATSQHIYIIGIIDN